MDKGLHYIGFYEGYRIMKAQKYTKETIQQIAVENKNFPEFKAGDTIAVSQRIKEGDKERIQIFEGDVIAMRKAGAGTSFVIRKMGAHNVHVERIIPLYSPLVADIKVIKRGDVRRAKLYYVRDRLGKAARIKEKIIKKDRSVKAAASVAEPAPKVEQSAKEGESQA